MLQSQHAQHDSAPQHAERRQHAQRAEHSMHTGFTATVSMTARCRQQSPESWNSNSSVVSHCCATVHSPEVTSSLSIHASLSPRKVSKAVKHGRQGELASQSALVTDQRHLQEQLPKQSSLVPDQRECVPAKVQLQQQLPKQSSLMPGQRECVPAQVQLQQQLLNQSSITIGQHKPAPSQLHPQLQEQLPTQASPYATQSPQPVTSHSVQLQVSRIVSAKSLSRASSIVATQQAVSRSSTTVRADAQSQLDSQRGGRKLSPPSLSQQQAAASSCTSPVQPAGQLQPVNSESSAGSTGQLSTQPAAGKQPVEPKPSSPAVLRRVSSQTTLTSQVRAGQGRARHDGRGAGRAQPPGPQAEAIAVPCSDSASRATDGSHTEGSGATQPQLTALPRSDSASSALRSVHHTDSCQAQPQQQQQTDADPSTGGSCRQPAAPPTASTQRPQLRNEVGSGSAHRPQLQNAMHNGSRSSSMQLNLQSDLGVQQEVSVSPLGSSNSTSRLFPQSSFTAPQDSQQPDRLSRQKLLLFSCSAQQDIVAQPECDQDHGVSRAEGLRAEGLALLQEQSQLALATHGSCSELSREGLEEDNCRLRHALAAIEQQLGMIRNQQVTESSVNHHMLIYCRLVCSHKMVPLPPIDLLILVCSDTLVARNLPLCPVPINLLLLACSP